MKLAPETVLISVANAGIEGGKTARPRPGAQPSSALDFFSQLRDRSGTGHQATLRSGRNVRPELAGESSSAVAATGNLTPHRSAGVGRAAADLARPAMDANSARPSKALDSVRTASVVGDARASSEPVQVASVDWPWLAIATGGLSYRPTTIAVTSAEVSHVGASVAPRTPVMQTEALPAHSTLGRAAGAADQPASPALFYSLSAMTLGSPADAASDVRELSTAAWPLPAELRELLERRRLRLVEDGDGGLHLFARDFAMDDAQTAHWAASLKNAYQAMNQTLRALWINGRPYEVQTGELHDR